MGGGGLGCNPTFSSWGYGGCCKPPSGFRGRAPEANGFWQNLLQINFQSGLFSVAVYTPNSDPISDVHWLVRRNKCMGSAVRGCTKLVDIRMLNIENDCDSYRTGIILVVMAAPLAARWRKFRSLRVVHHAFMDPCRSVWGRGRCPNAIYTKPV